MAGKKKTTTKKKTTKKPEEKQKKLSDLSDIELLDNLITITAHERLPLHIHKTIEYTAVRLAGTLNSE